VVVDVFVERGDPHALVNDHLLILTVYPNASLLVREAQKFAKDH
jgi:hypothetical protein